MPFPSPPWRLRGSLWLSLFAVRSGTPERPAGLYGAAFVDYVSGPLTYHELLVARLVRDGAVPRVHITDIWVDSEASRDGGRSLWAIPKELADLHLQSHPAGPTRRAAGDANLSGSPITAARFTSPRVRTPRTPYAFTVAQQREDGTPVVTRVSGSARTLPARGRWDFGADGPLAWLGGRTPVASLVLSDFTMTFGA